MNLLQRAFKFMKLWVTELRKAQVPESIIKKFYDAYGIMPAWLVQKVASDDRKMGIGWASIPYSNSEVVDHDLYMLLAKEGYPLDPALKVQATFAIDTLEHGAGDLIFGVLSPEIALVGSLVGLGLMIWRAM